MARTRIRELKLNEVSFVGKGDNPSANILLLKIKKEDGIVKLGKDYNGENKNELLKKWLEDNPTLLAKDENCAETFSEIMDDKNLRDQVWNLCWMLEDSLGSIVRDDTVTDKTAMISQSIDQFKEAITSITKGEDKMTPEEIAALKKAKDEADVKVETLTKENETLKAACSAKDEELKEAKVKKEADDKEDPIYKGLPDAVIVKMKNDEARITKMEDENLTREYIGKATEVVLVGKADVVGDLLKSIAKHSTELAGKVFDLFKTANARIQEGDLLKEKGKNDLTDSSVTKAYDKIVAKATELRKTCPELSAAQAFTKVYDTDIELRTEYLKERE